MTTTSTTAELVDYSQVDALLGVAGRDGVNDILRAFWRSTDDLSQRLFSQVQNRDFTEAARTSHAIKGSAGNVGARMLAAAAKSVESCCKASDEAGARAAVENLNQAYAQTRLALTAHLEAAA